MRAAIAIQRDLASFNADKDAAQITLKLGLHQGACIAVTTGEILDYFGTTVNIAARLEGESRGGDIVLSAEIVGDAEVARVLAGTELTPEAAVLHGLAGAKTFYRLLSPGE